MRNFLRGLVFAVLLPFAAMAQNDGAELDYILWEATATRAEEAIDAGRASDLALENLRSQLTVWRDGFSVAQSANGARIDSLRAQIAALGPEPDSGGETEAIAAQRQLLTEALSAARAPVQTAQAAWNHANGLISQVDGIIRARQTDELLSLGPTPVNPALWGPALAQAWQSAARIRDEFASAWDSPTQRTETREDLPAILILALVGAVLLLRGRAWPERLAHWLQSHNQIAWRWLLGFVISLGQVVLPSLGVFALCEAIYASGLVGLTGDVVLQNLPVAGFVYFSARWIGVRVFPRHAGELAYFNLSDQQRTEGRFNAGMLGLLVAVQQVLEPLAGFERFAEETLVVLSFPLLLLVALLLTRLGQLLISHYRNELADTPDEAPSYRCRMLRLLGRITVVLAITGVALAAIGYFTAAVQIVFPVAATIGLLAFVLILQRLMSEIWVLASGRGEAVRDGLVPVLAGFALLLVALPFLALIWGMRQATLAEFWTRFLDGVPLGDTRISPTVFITFAVIFAFGYAITRLFQGALRATILPKTKIDPGAQNAIVSGSGYVGIFLAALVAITGAGIDLSALAIVAGALSVGIGFGLQNIVSNFVAGIILLIERPIAEGDWIEVSGKSGTVRSISVRSTRIETFDRADVIIPNADLISGVVMNMTKGSLTGRIIVSVGVAYGSDTRRVETILREIAEAQPLVVMNPGPGVILKGFGADSIDFEIRAVLRDINFGLGVRSEINHQIIERFAAEGIEIPFAQRDIWLRNPEVLTGVPPVSAPIAGSQIATDTTTAADDIDLGVVDAGSAGEGDDPR